MSSISVSTALDATYLTTTSNWPISVQGGTAMTPVVVTITADATLPTAVLANGYFNILSDYITIDGGGHTITYDSSGNGLVRNGTNTINGHSNVTVKNVNIAVTSSAIAITSGGWVCQSYFGRAGTSNKIDNCSSSGLIRASNMGGIIGARAGYGGQIEISNCYSTGDITGAGLSMGGIVGALAGQNGGQVVVTNCYSTGMIGTSQVGGIIGAQMGYISGQVTISNCYSTGSISGSYAGGICGSQPGYNTNQLCTITNCYSTGNISGTNAGGICGAEVGYNDNTGSYTPQVQITNCYALGSITSGNGGICGGTENDIYTNIPSVFISNCYVAQAGDLISSSLQIKNSITLSNTYSASGSWSDASAASALVGAPSSFPGVGSIWTSTIINTPFTFSTSSGNTAIACFLEGTVILCVQNGEYIYRPIEKLQKGDLVMTKKHGALPIALLGHSKIDHSFDTKEEGDLLFRCPKESYPDLFEDLILTGWHSILVDTLSREEKEKTLWMMNGELFVTDGKYRLFACLDKRARKFEKEGIYQIYHLALESDDIYINHGIFANGLLVESCSQWYLNNIESKMQLI